MLGRTPLFFAVKHNNLDSVKLLLSNRADPSIKTNRGESCMDMAKGEWIIKFLKKAILLKVTLPMIQMMLRPKIWETEGLNYFKTQSDFKFYDFD